MISVAQFIANVESFVDTPVVHMGRVPGSGLDCTGVVICGAGIHSTHSYGRLPSEEQLTAGLHTIADVIPPSEAVPGCVLQVFRGRQARHVMVLVGDLIVVHAWDDGRIVRRVPIGPETVIKNVWKLRSVNYG